LFFGIIFPSCQLKQQHRLPQEGCCDSVTFFVTIQTGSLSKVIVEPLHCFFDSDNMGPNGCHESFSLTIVSEKTARLMKKRLLKKLKFFLQHILA
jgi:hypothetical protein